MITEPLPDDAYDTTRLGEIIEKSEEAYYKIQERCKKLIHSIDYEFINSISLINPEDVTPTSDLTKFVAIDGTRDIISGHTHARLFAGGFAVSGGLKGRVSVMDLKKSCAYSIVTLPYRILTSTNEYITESTSTITNLLMLLSEVYVAYLYAMNEDVNIILLDRPLCGTMANTTPDLESNSPLQKLGAISIKEGRKKETVTQSLPTFEEISNRLFTQTEGEPLKVNGRYLSSRDIMYLVRVGLEKTIELCNNNGIMLVGMTKTTSDCSFLRLLMSLKASSKQDCSSIHHLLEMGDDIRVVEWWSEPYKMLIKTREYDTALMTRFLDPKGEIKTSMGYAPPKRILRSYMSFGLPESGGFAFAVERVVGRDESPPLKRFGKDFEIYLYEKERSTVQNKLYELLFSMCIGAFIEALYYPLPLALAHRYAKSNYDYIGPRLKTSRYVFARDISYSDIKEKYT